MIPPETHPIFQRVSVSSKLSKRSLVTIDNGFKFILLQDDMIKFGFTDDETKQYKHILLDPSMEGELNVVSDSDGNYVCIYNDKEARVVEIPWNLWDGQNTEFSDSLRTALQLRTYSLNELGSTVKKVLFHPLGVSHPCLIVLFDNSNICLIDVREVFEINDITSKNFINFQNKNIMGISARVDDILDIEFSSDKLSLFAVTDSDVFMFYPCLCPTVTVTAKEVDSILEKSIVLFKNLNKDSADDIRRNIIKQIEFVSHLRNEIERQTSSFKINDENSFFTIKVQDIYCNVKAQGSFSIASFPEQLYSQSITSIISLPIGDNNELFLLSFDDGTIIILFRDLESSMSWDSIEYAFNNSFVIIETLKLSSDQVDLILNIPTEEGKFIILGENSGLLVDTSSWSRILNRCIQSNDVRELADIDIKSKIETISKGSKIDSASIWCHSGKQSLLLITGNSVVNSDIFEISKIDCTETKADMNDSTIELSKLTTLTFSISMEEVLSALEKYKATCSIPYSKVIPAQIRQIPFNNDENEEQLKIITEISQEIGPKILQGQNIALMLHRRLQEQQNMFSEQLMNTNKTVLHSKEISEKYKSQGEILQQYQDRNMKINERMENLKNKIEQIKETSQYKNIPIGKKETAFFEEIKKQVYLFNDSVHKQQEQHESIKHLQKELDLIVENINNKNDNDSSNNQEWEELCELLTKDAKIIDQCNSELTQATKTL